MSLQLIFTPLLAWIIGGAAGWYLLRTPGQRLYALLRFGSNRPAFPDGSLSYRIVIAQLRLVGAFALLVPIFLTIMALLVAAGVISPAHN